MIQTLIINDGEYEFIHFDRAVKVMEEEYGYEGIAWNMVVASNSLEMLCDFLNDDGLYTILTGV